MTADEKIQIFLKKNIFLWIILYGDKLIKNIIQGEEIIMEFEDVRNGNGEMSRVKFPVRHVLLKDGREIVIREALPSDAASILQYLKKIGGESINLTFGSEGIGIEEDKEKEFLSESAGSEDSLMLIALSEGRIIGQSGISGSRRRERTSHICKLGISVLKEYWGLGAGSHIMDSVIDFARQRYEIMELEVLSESERAQALYIKKGFVFSGERPYAMFTDGKYYPVKYMYKVLRPLRDEK